MKKASARAPKEQRPPALPMSKPRDRDEREADDMARGALGGGADFAGAAGNLAMGRLAARQGGDSGGGLPGALPHEGARPLAPSTRAALEPGFGVGLGGVRVHEGPESARAAAGMGARAFSYGSDIWLGAGARESDRGLMAHELAHVVQGADRPPMVRRQTIAESLPEGVDLTRVFFSFELPEGTALSDDWNDTSTTADTTVEVAITPTALVVSFSPGLLVDMQFPLTNLTINSVTHTFASGATTADVSPSDAWFAGDARSTMTGKVDAALRGTRMADAGYDPLTDPDPAETARAIGENLRTMASSGGGGATPHMSNFRAGADINVGTPIRVAGDDGAALRIGGSISVVAELEGGLDELADRPRISRLTITGHGIVVEKDGGDIVALERIVVARGGAVTVEQMRLMGAAAEAAGTESALRLLLVIGLLSMGDSSDRMALSQADPNFDAEIVPGIARAQIQRALTEGIRSLIIAHANDIPGIDLADVFGVEVLGDFVPVVPPNAG